MSDPSPRTRVHSFADALRGLAHLLRSQPNARIHLTATAGVVGLSAWLRLSLAEWRWIVAAIALVWVAEAINTAFEALADALHPQRGAGIGRAKDVAAGAVLLASAGAAAIGALVLGPRLLNAWLGAP